MYFCLYEHEDDMQQKSLVESFLRFENHFMFVCFFFQFRLEDSYT